jgi:hypothetical protein
MAVVDGGEVDHLAGERATAQFDVDGMKVAWAGSRHAVEVNDRMARLVASDPVSVHPSPVRFGFPPPRAADLGSRATNLFASPRN